MQDEWYKKRLANNKERRVRKTSGLVALKIVPPPYLVDHKRKARECFMKSTGERSLTEGMARQN